MDVIARRPRKLYGTGQRCAEGVKVTVVPKPVVTSVLTLAPPALHRYVVWMVHELDLQFVMLVEEIYWRVEELFYYLT